VKLWRPVGSRKEEETNRDSDRDRQLSRALTSEDSKSVSGQRRSRFDQDKPMEFVIRVDPVSGNAFTNKLMAGKRTNCKLSYISL
jgi:hypothetical protein